MNIGRAIGGVGGAVAGIGIANAAFKRRAGALGPPLDAEPRTYGWRGIDVSITEAGDPDDPDVVLLHGLDLAATSREFRHVFHELATEYHVLAPDFPGFGRSERPPLVYSARLYQDFVRELLRDEAERPICVAAGLSGAYAVAADQTIDLERLVLIAPTATTTNRDHWLGRGAIRLPIVGAGAFNVLTTKPALRYQFRRQVAAPATVSDDDMDYRWRSAHQPGARYAPASLLSGMLDPDVDLGTALAESTTPAMLVWGRQATRPPLRDGRRLAERADRTLVVIDPAGSTPHVEQPAAVLEVLEGELAPARD